ncbi:MAG TPA: DNA methyltransferase [Ktedonobacteraceae bacterium]
MSWQYTHTEIGPQKNRHTYLPRRFTARLYDLYLSLVATIEGIEAIEVRKRYASLVLYRLLFIYFLQHLGLLEGDRAYLRRRFSETRADGSGFYRGVLRPLFQTDGRHTYNLARLAGLFSSHEIEERYPAIEVADDFFARLFVLFDAYEWQATEGASGSEGVITSEIMGALFEQQIHAREMGTYYTPGEVTSYIARNTLLPALFTRAQARCSTTCELETLLWHQLAREPLRYIYPALSHGYAQPVSPEIAAGLADVAHRSAWLRDAPPSHALPGETWREVFTRHAMVEQILTRASEDAPSGLDQLITWNVNQPLLAAETLRSCQQPELLAACYQSLRQLSVLDPTCGSGAFLCAAIPLLRDLHVVCLARMEELCRPPGLASLSPTYQHTFQEYLEEAGSPALRAFTSLQWIIDHNLYGVDLDAEAIEVCQLRLCLQLIAALPEPRQLDLPDHFCQHIRVGNSLLGSLTLPLDTEHTGEQAELANQQRAFSWRQAFPDPMERGGFDVVIGNPPYVAYQQVRPLYTLDGYTTLETGNLYALTMERATDLLAPAGRFGMIVPSSATCAAGYRSLQKLLLAQQALHIASFSDQRGHLFAMPHPRLCIILYAKALATPTPQPRVFTTPYIKLGTETRARLFERLSYSEATPGIRSHLIPRYGSHLELAIADKLACQSHMLGFYQQRQGAYSIYFTRKLSWYVQVTPFIPRILDAQGQTRLPSELKYLRFSSLLHARIAFAALNSNLFYWLITTHSDGRNLNMREVQGLPLDLASIQPELQQELDQLSDELEKDFLTHARMRPMAFQNQGSLTIQCLYPARSKPLIDRIDRLLARHYAFDELELDFLLHYDEKYRGISNAEQQVR